MSFDSGAEGWFVPHDNHMLIKSVLLEFRNGFLVKMCGLQPIVIDR